MSALAPDLLLAGLRARGVDLFTGVPCSTLGGLFTLLEPTGDYLPAANEGTALGLACGAAIGGRRPAVLIQNSGLGNLVNPLSSLAAPYQVPVLLLVGHRGDPAGPPDEPQHELMGRTTGDLLDLYGVAHQPLPAAPERLDAALDAACAAVAGGRSAALLVGRGTVAPAGAGTVHTRRSGVDPGVALTEFAAAVDAALVVATTGYASRYLFAAADRPENLYLQGSMGHASAAGLGLAVARPDRRVVVLDGDGACLMHLGSLSTVAAAAPANFAHVVLDNGTYESTGGQPSTSGVTRIEAVALAAGYRRAAVVDRAEQLPAALRATFAAPGPALLLVRTAPRSGPPPPRASAVHHPSTLRARFQAACGTAPKP
ncbi:MAG TPA: phosphonopyruvate decarboxylase [Mycobacteriales bacterium]|nr:phosphonopyruvate decarboxylase [Mycobacteriales bacterium]